MAVSLLFAIATMCWGLAVLRAFALEKGVMLLGVAPCAGLAAAAIATSWLGLFHVPPPIAGVVLLVMAVLGLGVAIREWQQVREAVVSVWCEQRLAGPALIVAVLVPIVGMGVGFAGIQAPLSPHDGAFHVETSDAFRLGTATATWYPPGLAALVGAVLQLLPWVDSAEGAFQLGLGLSVLAPIALFGLGLVVLRNLFAASAGALLTSFTYLFPYYPQIWGGWPQLMGLLLVIGVWQLAVNYLERPTLRTAGLVGLLVGAIVVTHGIEIYTAAIVLVLVALTRWRCLPWRRLLVHAPSAVGVALICSLPYLPSLVHWAGTGGAYDVGLVEGAAMTVGAKSTTAGELLGVFTLDALGIDLPVRVVLLVAGVVWVFRQRTGRIFVSAAGVFVGLAAVSTFFSGVELVRVVNAATYPWSLPFRHMTVAAIPLALIAGAGCCGVSGVWQRVLSQLQGGWLRRVERLGGLLIVSWAVLVTWALVIFLSVPAGLLSSYSADDAAAMAWLRAHSVPGGVVVNDGFADAGIWVPYKAGLPILQPRSVGFSTEEQARRAAVLSHVADLDAVGESVCAENVRYVYYGAKTSDWDNRRFPPVSELEASPALEEVFNLGGAAVFRARIACWSPS